MTPRRLSERAAGAPTSSNAAGAPGRRLVASRPRTAPSETASGPAWHWRTASSRSAPQTMTPRPWTPARCTSTRPFRTGVGRRSSRSCLQAPATASAARWLSRGSEIGSSPGLLVGPWGRAGPTSSSTLAARGAWRRSCKPDDLAEGDGFGRAVGLAAGELWVGADHDDSVPISPGVAYVFAAQASSWQQSQTVASVGFPGWNYAGRAVALEGSQAAVGELGDVLGYQRGVGSVHVFDRSPAGVWSRPQPKLRAPDGAEGDVSARPSRCRRAACWSALPAPTRPRSSGPVRSTPSRATGFGPSPRS